MTCCGEKRRQWRPEVEPVRDPGASEGPRALESSSVLFEYTGATALTVRGPITGRRYRFVGPGSRLAVDRRDAASIRAVPHLKLG